MGPTKKHILRVKICSRLRSNSRFIIIQNSVSKKFLLSYRIVCTFWLVIPHPKKKTFWLVIGCWVIFFNDLRKKKNYRWGKNTRQTETTYGYDNGPLVKCYFQKLTRFKANENRELIQIEANKLTKTREQNSNQWMDEKVFVRSIYVLVWIYHEKRIFYGFG